MAAPEWETFYKETNEPHNIDEAKLLVQKFVDRHEEIGSRIVLITVMTSATFVILYQSLLLFWSFYFRFRFRQRRKTMQHLSGTSVPLEGSTVRFIDNFSIGTRGSASAEYFLQHGYAVIFLHRGRSLAPYTRHLPQHHLLDILEPVNDGDKTTLTVKTEYTPRLLNTVQTYQRVMKECRLLQIDFTTLVDYLHLLKACSLILARIERKALLYLAAAVSDFYIPSDKMPQHKIQSSDGPLQLSLELVPKMLEALVKTWVKNAFVVSFKLETDSSLLIGKAKQALEKYQHQIVIGNVLHTRKTEVCMVTQDEQSWIRLGEKEIADGVEIESKIVQSLNDIHAKFLELEK